MSRRTIGFVIFALGVGAICVALGFWQLDRRAQRRAMNAAIRAPLSSPPQPYESVRQLGDSARFRRVTVRGVPDYMNERVHASRTRNGSPGVHILTPLRLPGSDRALLVNRGWVYAPDGMNADLSRWREGDTLTVTGFVDVFSPAAPTLDRVPPRTLAGGAPVLHRLTAASASAGLPYPIEPVFITATEVTSIPLADREIPPRLEPPSLDEGPHLGYAIQWFAFASIAILGTTAIVVRSRHGSTPQTDEPRRSR